MSVSTCPVPDCNSVDEHGNRLLITTPVCDRHHHMAARTLHDLPRTYVLLNLVLTPATGTAATERVSTSKTRPLPINAEARSLQQDALNLVLRHEEALRADQGWTPAPQRGREGPTLAAAALVLESNLDLALHLNPQLATALAELARRTRGLLGTGRAQRRRLPTPCPACGCLSLIRTDGQDDVVCDACGHLLDHDQYHAHTTAVAEEYAA